MLRKYKVWWNYAQQIIEQQHNFVNVYTEILINFMNLDVSNQPKNFPNWPSFHSQTL